MNQIVEEDLARIHAAIGSTEKFLNSTVVMTGCAGFLGFYFLQYLVKYSRELGVSQVIGLDTFILERPQWLIELEESNPSVLKVHHFDISKDDISKIDGAESAKFVIHGASIASPTFYRRYPVETIDANIWGLRSLLDFYREKSRLEGFLFFSSSEIYGDPPEDMIPTPETFRGNVSSLGPRACYDESKRFGETISWVYANQFGMPITIARPFNNFGPGMRLGDLRLPADFARAVLSQNNIKILSDGSPTRTFCYVSDSITGYLLCLLHGEFDVFNIGTESPEVSVLEFANINKQVAKEIFDYEIHVEYEKSMDPDYLTHNPTRRCPDISKAKTILNYRPSVGVEEGVRRYLTFLKSSGAK